MLSISPQFFVYGIDDEGNKIKVISTFSVEMLTDACRMFRREFIYFDVYDIFGNFVDSVY